MPGNTQELCPGCNTLISVAFKTCSLYKQLQLYKTKVATKRCNFQNKKAEWKKSIKKNNNRTVVLNSCHVMLLPPAPQKLLPPAPQKPLPPAPQKPLPPAPQKPLPPAPQKPLPPAPQKPLPPALQKPLPPAPQKLLALISQAHQPPQDPKPRRPKIDQEMKYTDPVQQMEASKKKKKYECPECCRRVSQNNFDYSKVLKKRVRGGTEEVLIRWVPCKTWSLEYAFVLGLGWQPERIPTDPSRRFMRSNWSWQSAGTLSREHHNAAGSTLGQEVEK
ncbi:nuclear pore complex-interacting protein family member B7-like isoform X2 [Triplophysa dalaica]|uniref:nuclear pore complex-interacting protein family member B7-like isoform X2 n=1 Tax=Triplophysa dalaica TaxID=1582913 RepID=UPI0024DF5253|nr:nuclear pore complex-interacting protein family member B7-like isoform X2 [Triplophysa dalaica]